MTDKTKLFKEFDEYPWEQDEAFQNGLKSALSKLSNSKSTADIESITTHARIYFFKRKRQCKEFDYNEYTEWKKTTTTGADVHDNPTTTTNADKDNLVQPHNTTTTTTTSQPPDGLYPSSFQAIVDLILSGKPVPGIKSIPNIVLGESAQTESKAPQRKKPWQQQQQQQQQS